LTTWKLTRTVEPAKRDEAESPGWYRVVGGRYATRGQAEAALAGLRASGLDAVILSPGREP